MLSYLSFLSGLLDQRGGRLLLLIVLLLTRSWIFTVNVSFSHHIFFIIWLFCLSYLVILTAERYGKRKKYDSLKYNLWFLAWTLLCTELILGCAGVGKRFLGDSSLGCYWAPNNTEGLSYYYVKKPGERYRLKTNEFDYSRIANSMGAPDNEWSKEKGKDTYRILCLGDSFTEGDGAPYDSSYVAVLRRNLQRRYPSVEVLNAGNCGSDPFFNFKNLEDRLIAYQPDLVVQSFTSNDMDTDMMIRGGMERFQPDSTLKFRNKYWWEQIYASSYVVRLLVTSVGGYNNRLIRKAEIPEIREENEKKALDLFKRYKEYSEQKHFDLLVFNLAFKYDYTLKIRNEVDYKLMPQIRELGINFKSLRSCYDDYFRTSKKAYTYYYWGTDAHHNSQGYEMMALCLQPEIERYLEKFYGKDSTGN